MSPAFQRRANPGRPSDVFRSRIGTEAVPKDDSAHQVLVATAVASLADFPQAADQVCAPSPAPKSVVDWAAAVCYQAAAPLVAGQVSAAARRADWEPTASPEEPQAGDNLGGFLDHKEVVHSPGGFRASAADSWADDIASCRRTLDDVSSKSAADDTTGAAAGTEFPTPPRPRGCNRRAARPNSIPIPATPRVGPPSMRQSQCPRQM